MPGHNFTLGDIVCFQSRAPVKLPDSFEVTALMPQRDGVVQYKIKSEYERFERVVQEDDIELVHSDRPANSNVPRHLRN
ncbi:hypothetical protein [Oricola sp.]|uniref:hypothetical protein n=1 Tax=Oricola sp. TaxID=1979950 RepID=UPI0025E891C5|nr:hypothetical protein [Oricola sp.]MCI5075257.1 hypothetical protein [Oricola sp.]